jgi:hypothetical protein
VNSIDTLLRRYRVEADPLRTERRIELVAVALACILLLQLIYVAIRLATGFSPQPMEPAAEALQVRLAARGEVLEAEQRAEIRMRPLFWEGRRPLETVVIENVAPEEKPAVNIDGVKLLGIFGSGDTAGVIALVNGEKRRIFRGETLKGWTLEAVEPDRIVLVEGARREEIALQKRAVIAVQQSYPAASNETDNVGASDRGAGVGTAPDAGGDKAAGSTATPRSLPGVGIKRSPVANNGKE